MNTSRILGLAAAATTGLASLAVLLPAPASAAPLVHTVNTVQEVSCVFSTPAGDFASFQASSSSNDQSIGSLFAIENQDGHVVLAGERGTAAFGSRFAAAITAVEPDTGRQVGTATVTADVTVGNPVVEQVDERNGNIRTTGTVTTSEYTLDHVAATAPGFTLINGELPCTGSTIVFDLYSTNPRVHVVTQRGFDSQICDVAGIPDAQVLLSGETRQAPYAEFVIDTAGNPLKAQGEVAMRGRKGVLRAPLREISTDKTVAGLDLGVALARTAPPATSVEAEGKTVRVRTVTRYRADITAKISDGRRGQVSCPAAQVRETTLTFRR